MSGRVSLGPVSDSGLPVSDVRGMERDGRLTKAMQFSHFANKEGGISPCTP